MVTKVRSRVRGRPAYIDVLTPAEWRVVHRAQHGLTNKEIAGMLQISIDGVKYHVANALSKGGGWKTRKHCRSGFLFHWEVLWRIE